ncbi:death-associated inhibitor of apoptosis 1-like [Melanaphis sacchari]|uniref:death-associated inhibitor of apoptosis 1-like n=1 Tax=Melanaphis sacchari TaxID=742174 RepID=UPI000DC152EC|nr:death-associated inhibitor of apoptosis 1-like [Melanaphis sacchari]
MNFQNFSNNFCSLVSLVRNNAYPKYPEYTTFSSRLKTFNLFPLTSSQDKYSLAESGFKYSGKKDIVECFCCGLILHNWEKDDIPWIEHTRWNPKYIYVLLSKGNQFVENIINKYGKINDVCQCDCEFKTYDTVI